jgi:hypothetical protein
MCHAGPAYRFGFSDLAGLATAGSADNCGYLPGRPRNCRVGRQLWLSTWPASQLPGRPTIVAICLAGLATAGSADNCDYLAGHFFLKHVGVCGRLSACI